MSKIALVMCVNTSGLLILEGVSLPALMGCAFVDDLKSTLYSTCTCRISSDRL